jgi:hypothetical protein
MNEDKLTHRVTGHQGYLPIWNRWCSALDLLLGGTVSTQQLCLCLFYSLPKQTGRHAQAARNA